jgi:hypothetical protein
MGYLGKCQCNEHYSFDLSGSKNCSLCSSGYAKASTTNDGICCKKQKENNPIYARTLPLSFFYSIPVS